MKARIYFEGLGFDSGRLRQPLKAPRHLPIWAQYAFTRGWLLALRVRGAA